MAIYYPRHVLHVAAVLETFDGGTSSAIANAVEWDVVPRSARLTRNDVHTADTLAAVLDFRNFPFDPRLVRAASVAYFAGDVGSTDRDLPRTDATLRFLGVVDVPEVSLSADDQTVTMECRDYTALLLGHRALPAMAVPLGRSLKDIVRDLLATLPGEQSSLLTAVMQGPGGEAIPWPAVGAGGRRAARLPVEPRDTLWSVLRRLAEQAGLVVFVDLDRLVFSTSRTLGADGQLRADDLRLHVVFGEQLSELRMKRTMQAVGRPVVLAQYDPRTGQTTRSQWPTDAVATPRARGRGARGRTNAPVVTVRRNPRGATVSDGDTSTAEEFAVTGSLTAAELAARAEAIYRQRMQHELEGAFSTAEMALPTVRGVRGRPGEPFDLYAVHTATTLYADIAEHAIANEPLQSDASRERALVAMGYDATVAAALVRSWRSLGALRLPFIVRKAELNLDERGFSAQVDFMAMLSPPADGAVRAELAAPG